MVDFGSKQLIILAAKIDIGLTAITKKSVNLIVFDICILSVIHVGKYQIYIKE
jgi:hypothetical protein